jgi:FkbM family methyltransferase
MMAAGDLATTFPIPSYSQAGEDRLVWKLFGYRAAGTYVDVGCHHPTNFSNTYLLYRAGWRGVVIDADAHFLPLYATIRPEDAVVHAAIGGKPGPVTLYTFPDRALNTVDAAAAATARRTGAASRQAEQVTVEARRLDEVLEVEAVAQVDFLNIDVEGADLDVLEANDWERWVPEVIAIEDHRLDLADVRGSDTWRYLSARRYPLHSKCNYTSVYVRSERGR